MRRGRKATGQAGSLTAELPKEGALEAPGNIGGLPKETTIFRRGRPRILLIVSRSHPQLYGGLERTYASDLAVGVILDRRQGERRQRTTPQPVDRRLTERRSLNIEDDLLLLGWAAAAAKTN